MLKDVIMSVEDKNATSRNSNQKEVEKYIKFFVFKSLQAVVSARTGIPNKTKCNPSAKGQDWFNISLHESEANKRLQNRIRELVGKKIPTLSSPICLDIVLKTYEGSFIVLETWQLVTDHKEKEVNQKNHFSIYNRLGVLLKSVLSISRVLPSFNLSKKNDKDFSLFFKLHFDVYKLHQYEMHNIVYIGSVKTPVGNLSLKVMYRNKIWLSGSLHAHTYTINGKDDTLIPLIYDREKQIRTSFQSIDMFESELASAVSDNNSEWTSNLMTSNYSWNDSKDLNLKPNSNPHSLASIGPESGLRQVAAFAEPFPTTDFSLNALDLPKLPDTPPFESLLQDILPKKNNDIINNDENKILEVDKDKNRNKTENLVTRQAEAVGFEDDFVLVELRPAFFSEDDSVGNLYKQCQSPVPLEIFSVLEQEDEHSEGIDLDTQLEKYQKDLHEFQDFFQTALN